MPLEKSNEEISQTPEKELFYSNDFELLDKIIEQGLSVNTLNNMGESAIFRCGFEKARFLLQRNADVNIVNIQGDDVFTATLKSKKVPDKIRIQKCKLFIKHGYDVTKLKGDNNPLFYVSNEAIADFLIKQGVSPFDINSKGQNVFFNTKMSENMVVKYKNMGVNINQVDLKGYNPLVYACLVANDMKFKLVENLLKAGIDPYYTGNETMSAHPLLKKYKGNAKSEFLKFANIFQKTANFKFSQLKDKEGKNPLFYARTHQAITKLIEFGIDVNAVNSAGNTALMVKLSDDIVAKSLLANGANINLMLEGRPWIFSLPPSAIAIAVKKGYNINNTTETGENAAFFLENTESDRKRLIELKENGLNFLHVSNEGLRAIDVMPEELKIWARAVLGEEFSTIEKSEIEDAMRDLQSSVLSKKIRI